MAWYCNTHIGSMGLLYLLSLVDVYGKCIGIHIYIYIPLIYIYIYTIHGSSSFVEDLVITSSVLA